MASQPLRTVHLRRSSSSPRAAAEVAAIAVDGGAGVDLARVGLALGLDPTTVRLNGYFLSRGPDHVSSAVTWRALLAFFAARGLPTGAHADAPVAVHAKPAAPPASDPTTLLCSKRKSVLEVEKCPKKRKPRENRSALSKPRDDLLSDEIILGLKRRLRLEDTSPAKKIKQLEYSSDTQQPVNFSCSFVNGNGKRPPDEEMVTSLPWKRVR
ncbi:uncharacterized protein LOC133927354 [Phragmites australis]|uniref:uncharacterized protein LOC133927354 n=1 Tax=Phragmites australis TaxID=29695 RepID=UPI002D79ABEA|nr:uncharacterized protein LOC133927354 [Phragmites australis]